MLPYKITYFDGLGMMHEDDTLESSYVFQRNLDIKAPFKKIHLFPLKGGGGKVDADVSMRGGLR